MQDEADLPVLAIGLVDRDRLDISASGAFHGHDRDAVEQRLQQFMACGFAHLRIDLSGVTALAPEIEQLFVDAAALLELVGGVLEVKNARPGVFEPGRGAVADNRRDHRISP